MTYPIATTKCSLPIDDPRLVPLDPQARIDLLSEVVAACLGDDPELPRFIAPLSWAETMLAACETPAARCAFGGDDPDAWREMCAEVRACLDRLQVAFTRPRSGAGLSACL